MESRLKRIRSYDDGRMEAVPSFHKPPQGCTALERPCFPPTTTRLISHSAWMAGRALHVISIRLPFFLFLLTWGRHRLQLMGMLHAYENLMKDCDFFFKDIVSTISMC